MMLTIKQIKYLLIIFLLLLSACAELPEEKVYSTKPDSRYAITYLLADFEERTNKNAEGIDRGVGLMGYHYMFEDPKSALDAMIPHASESALCKREAPACDCKKEKPKPIPKECSVLYGIQANQSNPLNYFNSVLSFHINGSSAGNGVGFGTYFSNENPVLAGNKKAKQSRPLLEHGQEGFVMWATGNATVEVSLNMPDLTPISDGGTCDEEADEGCYDFHKVTFKLDGEWRQYHASFDEFEQDSWGKSSIFDPNQFINIQVKVLPKKRGQVKEFDVWIDELGFYGGQKWEFVDRVKQQHELSI